MTQNPDKNQLRQQLRQLRMSLSKTEQQLHSQQLATRLVKTAFFRKAESIAAYLPQNGELDPTPLIKIARAQGKSIYLPVLDGKQLCFVKWHKGSRFTTNRFGITEPVSRNHYCASQIDLLLLPLVGFDDKANRLGMGGGFYDRTLAFKQHQQDSKPVLIGLAHSCQHTATLPTESWDIPLQGVMTEKGFIKGRK